MLCRNCGKRQATTHITKTINGVTKEYHLCPECAAEMGYNDFDLFDINDFWGSLFNNQMSIATNQKRCSGCNASFDEIIESGKMGCPVCYETFREEITPTLYKMHGKTEHKGNSPKGEKEDSKIEKLQEKLQKAIENEEFEQAAKLRDEIKKMRSENNE